MVTKKKSGMKRVQIRLTPEQYEKAQRMAKERGISLSQLCREAIEYLDQRDREERREGLESLKSIIGIVKGGDPNASVDHDRILYERGEQD